MMVFSRQRRGTTPQDDRNYCSNPNTPTLFVVPTNTLPFTTVGVMNLLPAPNWSRPPLAWLLL